MLTAPGRGCLRLAEPPLAVVDVLQGDVEILAFQQALHILELILLLGGDPQFLALYLSLDALRPLVSDDLRNLLRVVLGNALFQVRQEPVLLARELRLARVQDLQRHATPDQLVLEKVKDGVGPFLAVGPDFHGLVARPRDGRPDAAEVEPGADLLGCLVQRVVDFFMIDLRDDVEGTVSCHGSRVDARVLTLRAGSAILHDAVLAGRHTAGCPSGQRERSVKPSAQPTLVRTQHLPPPRETAPGLRVCGQGLILSGSGGVRFGTVVYGCSWLSGG